MIDLWHDDADTNTAIFAQCQRQDNITMIMYRKRVAEIPIAGDGDH